MVDGLCARLTRLEAEAEIRRLGARYMALCDEPPTAVPGRAFEDLFTTDCIWEGIGGKASREFGRVEGREKLTAWFDTMRDPPRYSFNVHFLTSEMIEVDVDSAFGTWVMFQAATPQSDVGELRVARLSCRFRRDEEQWRMSHFQTESLLRLDLDTDQFTALLGVGRE